MTPLKMRTSISPRPDSDARANVDRVLSRLREMDGEDLLIEPLSDLSRDGAAYLRRRWDAQPADARLRLVRALTSDAEANIERNYERVLLIALEDESAATRLAAVQGLWEARTPLLLDILLDRVEIEPEAEVRAAEATTLGRFALMAECDELEPDIAERLRAVLLRLIDDDPSRDVRRRALESAGYLAEDAAVAQRIERAYDSDAFEMRVSSVHAMGRQADSRWIDIVHREFASSEPEIRYEAATAAGSIGDERSVPGLIDLVEDEDAEVRLAAIGALGAIGGRMAVNALRHLARSDSAAIADAASDALEEATVMANPLRPLF